MVVDTSALLAVRFAEPHGEWARRQLDDHAGELCMSTVNLAESLSLLEDRQPTLFQDLEQEILTAPPLPRVYPRRHSDALPSG